MNPIFDYYECPNIRLKTNIVAGEEKMIVRECTNSHCNGWSKNQEIVICPLCSATMELASRKTPVVESVNSCRNCFNLVKSENVCMLKRKKLSYQASDFSESCSAFKLERRATKKERLLKEDFLHNWTTTPVK
jgi:hypothetical protein